MAEQSMIERAREIIANGCGCDRNCEASQDGCGCKDDARAIVLMMREPTDDVARALEQVPGGWGPGSWTVGIDAALKESGDA